MENKETSDQHEEYNRDRLQVFSQIDGRLLRSGIRLDRTGNTERNGSDQNEP